MAAQKPAHATSHCLPVSKLRMVYIVSLKYFVAHILTLYNKILLRKYHVFIQASKAQLRGRVSLPPVFPVVAEDPSTNT
jgi:hypothetical protein